MVPAGALAVAAAFTSYAVSWWFLLDGAAVALAASATPGLLDPFLA